MTMALSRYPPSSVYCVIMKLSIGLHNCRRCRNDYHRNNPNEDQVGQELVTFSNQNATSNLPATPSLPRIATYEREWYNQSLYKEHFQKLKLESATHSYIFFTMSRWSQKYPSSSKQFATLVLFCAMSIFYFGRNLDVVALEALKQQ